MTFRDFGIGPVPKKLRVGLPSHIGTAVGGFGFSIFGGGVSVTAFPVQPVSRAAEQIASRTPAIRQKRKGKERLNTRGILVKKAETVNLLVEQPLASVNHIGSTCQDDFVIRAPFDRNYSAWRVNVDLTIGLVVDDGSDHCRARTGTGAFRFAHATFPYALFNITTIGQANKQ